MLETGSMSALPAQTATYEQPAVLLRRRYPLRARAAIIVASAAALWALIGLAGWFLYRLVA
jgi:hypothetical protein